MSCAGRYNISICQGATYSQVFTYKDSAGSAVDLTGYSARLKAKNKRTDVTAIISLTSGDGITLGGAAGTISLLISDTDTASYSPGTLVYDLELEDGSGVVTRLLQGYVNISGEVTS